MTCTRTEILEHWNLEDVLDANDILTSFEEAAHLDDEERGNE